MRPANPSGRRSGTDTRISTPRADRGSMRPDTRANHRVDARKDRLHEQRDRHSDRRDDIHIPRTSALGDARPDAYSPEAIEGAAHIKHFIRSDDGSGELKLVDGGASIRDKAAALEQVLLLLEQRNAGADASAHPEDAGRSEARSEPYGDVRSPLDGDRRLKCDDQAPCNEGDFPRQPPRVDDGRDGGDPGEDKGEDGDGEKPTPPVVRPPAPIPAVPVGPTFPSLNRRRLLDLTSMNMCSYSIDPFGSPYMFGFGPFRRHDPLWRQTRSVTQGHGFGYDEWLACFGYRIGPTYTWDLYEGRMQDAVVDCTVVTVQRHDDAVVSVRVGLPALGAATPEELRKAINERLSRGESVSLEITLRPEEVKEVSVRACDEDDER